MYEADWLQLPTCPGFIPFFFFFLIHSHMPPALLVLFSEEERACLREFWLVWEAALNLFVFKTSSPPPSLHLSLAVYLFIYYFPPVQLLDSFVTTSQDGCLPLSHDCCHVLLSCACCLCSSPVKEGFSSTEAGHSCPWAEARAHA